jgi:ElaB/YqjD/DUF883 family membrane-anchored ribosome-binding protein
VAPRNGHDKPAELLRREVAERRAAVRRTAAALEDRLRERGHQVSEAVDQARDTVEQARDTVANARGKLHGVDTFVHRYRYPLIGGAVGAGLLLGVRRAARRPREREVDGVEEAVRVVLERQRPSVFRSLFSAAAALAMRRGIEILSRRLMDEEPRESYEPRASYERLPLPPGRSHAE